MSGTNDIADRASGKKSLASISTSSSSTLYSSEYVKGPQQQLEPVVEPLSPSWGEVLGTSSTVLATRSGAATVFSKHLDAETGRYYYFNHETQESTWDAPVDDIPLFFTDEQKESIRRLHDEAEAVKDEERARRHKALATITREHRAARVRQEAEAKAKRDRESKNEWTRALLVAARENSDCNMSWTNIVRIDPSLYTFEKDYGKRLRSLQLVGVKLTELPPEVPSSLPGLETLNISNNQLTTLPDALVYLTSLTRLSVLGNRLESLPDRIGLLCSLKRVEISNNRLRYLPDTFAALTLMERLDLESNCIRLLPENLHYMSRLVSINVNRNELIRIPRCLHRMPNLKSFSANNNILSYITSVLCKSTSIEELRLCRNRITVLPERIGDLASLRELALDFNALSYLPMSFYMLTRLSTLRIEGNPALSSPTDDIITNGARAVVEWCRKRYISDETSRMRKIVYAMQQTLLHLGARRLEDSAYYDDSYVWKEEPCFAIDLDYFFETAVPLMNSVWHKDMLNADKELQKALVENMDEKMTLRRDIAFVVQSFPYLRREVMWAITNYFDAIGAVYMQADACFKRCTCVDELGNRRPCVPPKKGYMCRKRASILKKSIVLQGEKEERLWMKQKKAMVLEAEVRAEAEAIRYLESNEGKFWVAELSYARSEALLEEKKLDNLVARRKQIADDKKAALTRKFERRKREIQDSLEKKIELLQKDISEAKKTIRTTPEGYIREEASKKLIALSNEINELPEFESLKKLQDDYAVQCQKIDDEVLEIPEEPEDEDQMQEDGANFFDEVDEVLEKAAKEAAEKEDLVRSIRTATAERKAGSATSAGLVNKEMQMTERERKRTAEKQRRERERQRRQKAWDKAVRWKNRQINNMKLKISHGVRDFVEGVSKRMDHAKLILNGHFSEVQKELEYHIYQEYISDAVARARRQAEEECHKMDRIRSQWGDLGLEETFL
jgi:Leucine-rich repeat (LRR) protein